jgi:hypothetical protein
MMLSEQMQMRMQGGSITHHLCGATSGNVATEAPLTAHHVRQLAAGVDSSAVLGVDEKL